ELGVGLRPGASGEDDVVEGGDLDVPAVVAAGRSPPVAELHVGLVAGRARLEADLAAERFGDDVPAVVPRVGNRPGGAERSPAVAQLGEVVGAGAGGEHDAARLRD